MIFESHKLSENTLKRNTTPHQVRSSSRVSYFQSYYAVGDEVEPPEHDF